MTDVTLEKTIVELMQVKQCLRCRDFFTEMDDAGAWGCRVHPGAFQGVTAGMYGTERDTYTCCGISPVPTHRQFRGYDMAKGCTPCDHSIRRGIPSTLVIPVDRARVLFGERLDASKRPGVSFDHATNNVHIVRFGR